MFFKNATIYTYTNLPVMTEEMFEEGAFIACSDYQFSSSGFVAPASFEKLLNVVQDYALLCINTEEKILPAEVVRREAGKLIAEIEEAQGRNIYRKEAKQIQDDVTARLLPVAFTKHKRTHAVFDLKNQLLIVDASSAAQAEKVTEKIRMCIGSLPIKPIEARYPPEMGMNSWLDSISNQNTLPGDFSVGICAKLVGMQSEIHTLKEEPDLKTMANDLVKENAMNCVELELFYAGSVRVMFTKNLSLKGIKFTDLKPTGAEAHEEDTTAQTIAEADLFLCTHTISKIIMGLCTALSGSMPGEQK